MKTVFTTALLALITTFSTAAFAQETSATPNPAPTPFETTEENDSIVRTVPDNLQDRWSYHVHLQGLGTQKGVGIGLETPFAWDTLGLRAGISLDSIDTASTSEIRFTTAEVALKLLLTRGLSAPISPYALVAWEAVVQDNAIDATNLTSTWGIFYGADWQFVGSPSLNRDLRYVRSIYVEAGLMDSSLTFNPQTAPQSGFDGLLVRVGFRSYF